MDEGIFGKLNAFWTRLGIKPAVANTFVTGLVAILAYWIIDGGTFNAEELRLLVGNFLLALAGVASPPAFGQVMTKEGVRTVDRQQPGTVYKP